MAISDAAGAERAGCRFDQVGAPEAHRPAALPRVRGSSRNASGEATAQKGKERRQLGRDRPTATPRSNLAKLCQARFNPRRGIIEMCGGDGEARPYPQLCEPGRASERDGDQMGPPSSKESLALIRLWLTAFTTNLFGLQANHV